MEVVEIAVAVLNSPPVLSIHHFYDVDLRHTKQDTQ